MGDKSAVKYNRTLQGKVALIMVGQAFRARAFKLAGYKISCSPGTFKVQERLSKNHIRHLILPMEKMGLKVHIFLSDSGCWNQTKENFHWVFFPWSAPFSSIRHLKFWYGPHRIHSIVPMPPDRGWVEHIADMFIYVGNVMSAIGALYEYFVVTRYDVLVQRPLLPYVTGIEGSLPSVRPLIKVYACTHDYMHAFPAELWDCFDVLWQTCLRTCAPIRARKKCTKDPSCNHFGGLPLDHHIETRGGYVNILTAIGRALSRLERRELMANRTMFPRGVTAFGVNGEESTGDEFDIPPESKEDGYMPFFYRIG